MHRGFKLLQLAATAYETRELMWWERHYHHLM
jgi:hypothetical protein